MLSHFAKLLLVFTAFAPVLFSLAFVAALNARYSTALSYTVAAFLLTFLCIAILVFARKQIAPVSLVVKSLETADTEIVGFVLTYLLPLVKLGRDQFDARILAFVLLILAAVVWTSNAYHFNPMLGIFGYHFYKVTTEEDVKFVLLTRKNIYEAKKARQVIQLTEYMVLEVTE